MFNQCTKFYCIRYGICYMNLPRNTCVEENDILIKICHIYLFVLFIGKQGWKYSVNEFN
jgi:hypothetical protein